MNCSSTGEVDSTDVVDDPTTVNHGTILTKSEVEYPVSNWEVNHGCPNTGENHPGAEFGTVGNSAADKGNGDDSESCLESHERKSWVGTTWVGRVGHLSTKTDVAEVNAKPAIDSHEVFGSSV
ncbi:unannotated protein [freshwater metagenome]|uniref:Unannotated protein n=1 Tax=freshwater metagenome TaxID=449393 RepID=A0A6J6C2B8_9ZZZZ